MPATLTRAALANAIGLAVQNNAAYLLKPAPTGAESTAQVKALTRQINQLLRLVELPADPLEDDA